MNVDEAKFEAVVGNPLLAAQVKRSDAKTGQLKTGEIIAAPKKA
jgi:2-keto-4-pentenoate hydratase